MDMLIGNIIVWDCDQPFEYFCKSCHQLRLCLYGIPTMCQHCTSEDLIVGIPGTLDKAELIKRYKNKGDGLI